MSAEVIKRISLTCGILLGSIGLIGGSHAAEKIGIFEKILDASGSFGETTAAFEAALAGSNLVLHEKHDMRVPDGIQQARLYILTSPDYMAAAAAEPANSISAQIQRVAIYTYGEGKKTYINMANPEAHALVFYGKSNQADRLSQAAVALANEIRAVAAKVPGVPTQQQLEPSRKATKYQKYNGDGPAKMMAKFRNWEESQLLILEDSPENFKATVTRVERALSARPDGGPDDSTAWSILTRIPVGPNAVYFGITNQYTEYKCIKINSDFRSDGKTEDAPYPGVDHTAALPLEVLVINDGDKVRVVQYGEMWRMQLYFWDSGYLAFAKNTLIPSIISNSIEKAVAVTASE